LGGEKRNIDLRQKTVQKTTTKKTEKIFDKMKCLKNIPTTKAKKKETYPCG
jgi:hypothetical protein